MRLGELISMYLKDNDLSQRQFSIKCGLSNGYISMLINNRNPKSGKPPVPSLSTLLSIASGMGMTLDDMLRKVEDIDVNIGTQILPQTAPSNDVSDDQIKVALFGGDSEVTDAMWEEVKRFAEFVKENENRKRNG